MNIFSILKVDDEDILKQYPSDELRIDPRVVSPNQSGVTTAPIDGVSVILTETQYFKYTYLIISARVTFCTSSTCRIRLPTDTQTVSFRFLIIAPVCNGGAPHKNHPGVLST
jgi:hypothetical protein